ncbi:cell cycle transcriptional regulator TrcR [uncultured Candidatus Pelagibacter sp.]|uniref:cell cycle transcriptional regulator TrcR n=1 Tax=uncultured Candidatus Pelagibacter sp. TaxID=372654 RepID=UPI00260F5119|nr:cell cycle transcriptional regulator TrcR [uncultured Candidatus Pelagibacter sp.]
MSNAPLMPMATAVWLVENTTLTFKQIANFCNLHEVEIQGIADGEVAKGIKAYNPIISGQLSREEIELSSKDENRPLLIKSTDIEISNSEKKTKKYVPLSKRQDKPDSALWLIRQHNMLKDSQIAKLVGVTKNSVTSIRNKSYWNYNNLNPKDPVALNLFSQKDLIEALEKAERRIKREKKEKEKAKQAKEISNIE